MKAGDLVKLNKKHRYHPAYKNSSLYIVARVHGKKTLSGTTLVELYTKKGILTAFNMDGLEVVSESR